MKAAGGFGSTIIKAFFVGRGEFNVHIRLGYEIIYRCPQPTPMILNLNVHYTNLVPLAAALKHRHVAFGIDYDAAAKGEQPWFDANNVEMAM